jgi:hypothetical protein
MGFYAIRKLVESKKLSSGAASILIPIRVYSARGQSVHLLNKHELDDLYDLGHPAPSRRELAFVANQIIHSYVLQFVTSRSGALRGVVFSSADHRNKALYELSAAQMSRVFSKVGRDYPVWMSLDYSEARGDWKIEARPRRPLPRGA